MTKNAQQMRTMLPMGLREEMSVSTTSFRPGARLMTLQARRGQGSVSRQPGLKTTLARPRVTRAEAPRLQIYMNSKTLCFDPNPLGSTPHPPLDINAQRWQ